MKEEYSISYVGEVSGEFVSNIDINLYPLVVSGTTFEVAFKSIPNAAVEVTGDKPTFEKFSECLDDLCMYEHVTEALYIAACVAFDSLSDN